MVPTLEYRHLAVPKVNVNFYLPRDDSDSRMSYRKTDAFGVPRNYIRISFMNPGYTCRTLKDPTTVQQGEMVICDLDNGLFEILDIAYKYDLRPNAFFPEQRKSVYTNLGMMVGPGNFAYSMTVGISHPVLKILEEKFDVKFYTFMDPYCALHLILDKPWTISDYFVLPVTELVESPDSEKGKDVIRTNLNEIAPQIVSSRELQKTASDLLKIYSKGTCFLRDLKIGEVLIDIVSWNLVIILPKIQRPKKVYASADFTGDGWLFNRPFSRMTPPRHVPEETEIDVTGYHVAVVFNICDLEEEIDAEKLISYKQISKIIYIRDIPSLLGTFVSRQIYLSGVKLKNFNALVTEFT